MLKNTKFLFILLMATNAMGQDSLTFEIKTKLFKLGEVDITKTVAPTLDTVNFKLESIFKVYSFYTINYLMKAEFISGILNSSLASIVVNGKKHHYCVTSLTDTGYVVKSLDKEQIIHKKPITSGVTPLYFGEHIVSDSIFSEYSGRYRSFIIKNDSTYILDPSDPMEFIFSDEKILKVIVHNSIMNFYIVLKN